MVHPDHAAAYIANYKAAVEERRAWRNRNLIRRHDGAWRWFENYAQPLFAEDGRYLGHVGVTVDVQSTVEAEQVLRESEERQAFLLRFSDALRAEPGADAIADRALRMLFEELHLDRCCIGVYRLAQDRGDFPYQVGKDGLPRLPDGVRLSDFPAALRVAHEGPLVIDDVVAADGLSDADRRNLDGLGLRAMVAATLRKGGNNPLWAIVAASARARRWTAGEIALVEEAAERTWAAIERARAETALRESEELFRGFAENSADVLWIADGAGTRLRYLSPAFDRVFGEGRERIMDDLGRWADLVHPDDRQHAASFMPRVVAGEVAVAQYRVLHPGTGRVVHLRDTGFPVRDALSGRIIRVAGMVQDVTGLVHAGEALEAEKERFRTLAEGIPHLVWRSGGDGRWTWSSPQWRDHTGQTLAQSLDRGWLDAVHPDDRDAAIRAWADAEPKGRLDVEYRVRRASDGAWRHFSVRSVPLRGGSEPGHPEGRIVEWLGTATDIEDLKRLQEQLRVLVAELQHRTRNLLAVVRDLARRSIGPSPGRDEYDARLAALGRVQGFLSRSRLYAASLADIVHAELTAAGMDASGRVAVGGPVVELPGECVQTVALALHELATNAVKHGAIGRPSGRLSVTWDIEAVDGVDGERLVIHWRESGVGMPGGPPPRRGFGSELITEALPYQLDADTELAFTTDGVRCRITLPAEAFRAGGKQEDMGAQP